MLPPAHLRQGLVLTRQRSVVTAALKASTLPLLRFSPSSSQSRSFWGWRQPSDWASHLDPIYHRFSRVRTLKTRAKLLKNLRRRGKFEWDVDSKPFFTPEHVRFASHWDAKGRRQWYLNDDPDGKKDAVEKDGGEEWEGEGHELSKREKVWKEQMEAMRKRIEQDPYEAIFGKRFEPFWGPLVPSWMREEMGLSGWPKEKEMPKKEGGEVVKDENKAEEKKETKMEAKAATDPKQSSEPSSYSYASSTSWDSWTNQTKRTEWDSVSGQTRKYEYDPISNRMVQVETPKPAQVADATSLRAAPKLGEDRSTKEARFESMEKRKEEAEAQSKPSADSKDVSIPAKQSTDVRKSIPIPPPLSQPSHSVPLGFMPATSIGPLKITAVASSDPKPAVLAKLPKTDLDMLTANDVRASMGKNKPSTREIKPATPQEKAEMEHNFDAIRKDDAEIAAILGERDLAKAGKMNAGKSQWDQAETGYILDRELEVLQKKKEKLLKHERGLFHIERQKRELQKLDGRIKEVVTRVEKLNVSVPPPTKQQVLETSLQRAGAAKSASDSSPALQSSLERMQSKELPSVAPEPDDAAAHESTGPINSTASLPKDWSKQADLLQAERVRRTASKKPYPMTRWIDDMQARRAEYEAQQAVRKEDVAKKAEHAEKAAKLEKTNAMLEAEVKEQKFRMQAHENRYAHKIKSLRQELETAYKQSNVHSEKHLERIRYLEQELEKVQRAVGEGKKEAPTVPSTKEGAWKVIQGEGDFCTNVVKYADNGKWYKQPAIQHQHQMRKLTKQEAQKAEQKLRDQKLVREVREIYERRYGVIDTDHRQPPIGLEEKAGAAPEKKSKQVVEVESDVDLGEELARYEKEQPYRFKRDDLENEIAAQEREVHESQQSPAQSVKAWEVRRKLVDDKMPKLIPTEIAAKKTTEEPEAEVAKAAEPAIQWEEPPVYKVLAYDSGNDMMSTATTTSNFTGTETPISIPQALSRLYAPARFVAHFAELQREGYQVIYGTQDLLVFRMVRSEEVKVGLEEHGLVGKRRGAGGKGRSVRSLEVNPIDGTTRTVAPEQPPTGNSTSPTGFVNHDPVFAAEEASAKQASTVDSADSRPPPAKLQSEEAEGEEDGGIDIRHYPRVRREEHPHFTGTHRKWNLNHRRHHTRKAEERLRRKQKRGIFRWMLGAGLGTAVVMYIVGSAAEKARLRAGEDEWTRREAERRARWKQSKGPGWLGSDF